MLWHFDLDLSIGRESMRDGKSQLNQGRLFCILRLVFDCCLDQLGCLSGLHDESLQKMLFFC